MQEPPTETPAPDPASDQQLHQILRKLAHDLRSPLSIISMGIEATRAMKNDPTQLDALCDMMAREGVEPLKRIISDLVEKRS
jgi:signal transduction histidine kinase